MTGKRWKRWAAAAGAAVVALVAAELALRGAGFAPWRPMTVDAEEPRVYDPDPVLGWTNRPGAHRIPPYHPDGAEMRYAFLEGWWTDAGTFESLRHAQELVDPDPGEAP